MRTKSCLVGILANTPGGVKRSERRLEQMCVNVGGVDINCNSLEMFDLALLTNLNIDMKYHIYHQPCISFFINTLFIIHKLPYLAKTKPTNMQPGAVCHTTECFLADNNILITRLSMKKCSLLYTDDILCIDLFDN